MAYQILHTPLCNKKTAVQILIETAKRPATKILLLLPIHKQVIGKSADASNAIEAGKFAVNARITGGVRKKTESVILTPIFADSNETPFLCNSVNSVLTPAF